MLATLESSIKNLEKQLGDTTQLEKRDAELGLMDEEGDDDVEGGIAAELSKQGEIPREILLQMDSIKSQLKRIKDDPDFLDSLSEEGKAQMRRGLFDSLADRPSSSPGMHFLPQVSAVLIFRSRITSLSFNRRFIHLPKNLSQADIPRI